MWFYNEGSQYNFETTEALDFKGTNKVYATGSFQSTPTTHFLSADNPQTAIGGASVIGPRVGVYVTHFKLNGDSVSAFDAKPTAATTIQNSGTDLFVANNTVFLSGVLRSTDLNFDHSTLDNSATNGDDSFLARFRVQTDTFYKKEKEEFVSEELEEFVLIYPNPNDGSFKIVFQEEISGIISMFSTSGQLIFKRKFSNSQSVNLNVNVPDGLFYLIINQNEIQHRIPIIIQN